MGQLKFLEHSLGPRPLLSDIKIWGLMGLATLSVSVLLSPERP